jgi:Protein of unknown function (DUF3606)
MPDRSINMADDKTKQDARDRSRVAGGQDYEVRHLAKYYDISIDEARDLIERFGNDRSALYREAARLKK